MNKDEFLSITKKLGLEPLLTESFFRLFEGEISYRLPLTAVSEREKEIALFFNSIAEKLSKIIEGNRHQEQRLSEKIDVLAEGLVKVASGDFTFQIDRDFSGDPVDVLSFLVNNTIHELAKYIEQARIKAEEDKHRLEILVKERTIALEAANKELSRLAMLDGLTKIANRRLFDDYLQLEWKRHSREQQILSLILIDIDYFKNYNDFYGHLGGDECLIRVAKSLSEVINRPNDLVARYGGEEFVAILPNTNRDGCLQLAEKMRNAVSSLAIPHEGSEISKQVTLSLGTASVIPTRESKLEDLIGKADKALYLAKHKGRNQTVVYTD